MPDPRELASQAESRWIRMVSRHAFGNEARWLTKKSHELCFLLKDLGLAFSLPLCGVCVHVCVYTCAGAYM